MIYKTAQEAIDAFTEQCGDDFIEFAGMNCNDYKDDDEDECAGWQIGNRRCDCGNRRVSIDVAGNSTNGFYAYASAY